MFWIRVRRVLKPVTSMNRCACVAFHVFKLSARRTRPRLQLPGPCTWNRSPHLRQSGVPASLVESGDRRTSCSLARWEAWNDASQWSPNGSQSIVSIDQLTIQSKTQAPQWPILNCEYVVEDVVLMVQYVFSELPREMKKEVECKRT